MYLKKFRYPALLIISILAGFSLTTVSAERQYDIEMLIYKHTDTTEQFLSEKWPPYWRIPVTEESLDLKKIPRDKQEVIRLLQVEETQFADIISSITESSRYDILKYQSWRQPGYNKDDSIDILFNAGKIYIDNTGLIDDAQETGDESEPEIVSLFIPQNQLDASLDPLVNPNPNIPLTRRYSLVNNQRVNADKKIYELSGTIKVVLSRFLHVYTDLLLLHPVTITSVPAPAGLTPDSEDGDKSNPIDFEPTELRIEFTKEGEDFTTLHGFNIVEHRRMRSGELHYIDHPMLGIIIQIRPVEN